MTENALTPSRRPKPHRFLETGASRDTLIRAAAENHIDWFGGDLRYENGVHWKEGLIAFPQTRASVAGAQIDAILESHRARTPQQIACWSLLPTTPRDLGARLVARGFDWGWQPHWMGLDLHRIQADFPVPDGLHIEVDNTGIWEVDDLPYYTRPESGSLPPVNPSRPQWRLGAWLDGKIVGQTVVNMTYGRLGVAGIYNVAVVPAARGQGVGRTITAEACRLARRLGAHYALLNAATHIYERVGFVSLGYGQTWFLRPEVLSAPPPKLEQIAFFEAIGKGHKSVLDALRQTHPMFDLDTELPNGMTLIALAVRLQKPHLVRWLVAQGARLDILPAWDLGWREEAGRLVREKPDLVNRPFGPHGMTPLHEAAYRNDIELARLLLTANPDLTLRERQYNGTPLNWADVLGRPQIAEMIRAHQEP